MKFEFDTERDGPKEATALATALTVMYGPTIADILDKAGEGLEIETRAADGFPVNEGVTADIEVTEPSAADAFGQTEQAAPIGETAPATVDTAGIPWDERIHSGSKGTNKDGTWSRRRNTPDELFDRVMAELKGGAAGDPLSEAASPVPPPPASTTPAAPNTSTPVASPTSAETAPLPPPRAGTTPTFPQIMVKVTKAQGASQITKAQVEEYLGQFGMAAMKDLAQADVDTLVAFNAIVDGHVGE